MAHDKPTMNADIFAHTDGWPLAEEFVELTQNFFDQAVTSNADLFSNATFDPFSLSQTYMDAMLSIWRDPSAAIQAQAEFFRKSMQLWEYGTQRALGGEVEPVASPSQGDNRWRDAGWSDSLVFDYIKQSYLLAAQCLQTTVEGLDDLDDHDAKKLAFFTRQFTDALAPTNYAMTNPAVMRETLESKGRNLIEGLKNFCRDLEEGDGQLKIAMTDPNAFTLGENVAVTPGKVVFQNRMFQLLQYAPSTDKVLKRPLLIFPPWINKFYIMDLQPKNSLIKWMVDQGHTVFVVSWVNPDESYADTDFEDYLTDGLYTAVDAVERQTGENAMNVIGYCIGGTLLGAALAHMKAKGDERIKSATFFTALLDFTDVGDLQVFIDEAQLASIEQKMEQTGYMEGKDMAVAFNMLRANDLIWSFWVNNYLMGRDPMVFDLLYWNSDSTRLPAKMHSTYLRNMYLENNLARPGGITLGGVPIDLSSVDIPCYFLSTHDDHIAPWKATYRGACLLSGRTRFVLGGSGHIAGVINPPAAKKYCYWTGPARLPASPDDWFGKATQHDGSWWEDWHKWITRLSRAKVDARDPKGGPLKALEDTPGSYVAKRI